jgi:hypothetical protein
MRYCYNNINRCYNTKTLITNKCTKRVLSQIVTHSYMFGPTGSSSGRTFCYRYTKVALYSWVRMCCWLCTVGVNPLWSRLRSPESSRLRKQRSTQSTAHCHWTIKCNLGVTIAISSPWKWPSRVETCGSVLQLMIKLFVHLLVISVFVL